ncbi:MAG: hypothetical protein ACI9MC_000034 [Kiritimatiellia bacterium]|jgi:hypothetical protein
MPRLPLMMVLFAPMLVISSACEETDGPVVDDQQDDAVAKVSLSPSIAGRGQTLTVLLTADRSRFKFGDTQLSMGDGIQIGEITVEDGYTALVPITIDPDAELGARTAEVRVGDEVYTLSDAFTVIAESISAVEPTNGKMGEVLQVAIVGDGTKWESGYTWAGFGPGIDVLNFDVLSKSLATAQISIRPDARPGPRDVTVENGPQVVALYDGFMVDRAVITCEFVPGRGFQGDTIDFTITCLDTNWTPGTRIEFWDDGGKNPDIVISELQIIDAENMYGRMRLSNAAVIGSRDVYMTNDDEAILLPDAFEVADAPPKLNNVAISLGFDVSRAIDNGSGELGERVSGFAAFVIPLDPPCGAPPPPGSGPMPYDINGVFPVPPDAEPMDCPNPETVSAGDYVWFESDENVVTLEKDVIRSTGQIIYVGRDLTLDDYRFNKYYDLHTQGDPDGIPEVILEGVQPTVPADYYLVSPDLWGDYTQNREEPFEYTWTPAQTYPNAIFSTQISGTLVATGKGGFAGSIPWDDGHHIYKPSELTQLTDGPVSFSASSYIKGPYFGFPFSTIQGNQSDSALSTSAQLILE